MFEMTPVQIEAQAVMNVYLETCKAATPTKPMHHRFATEAELASSEDITDEELVILGTISTMDTDWCKAVLMSRGYNIMPTMDSWGRVGK